MGADNLAGIHRWQEWDKIFTLVPILVLDRNPFSHSALRKKAALRFARYRVNPRALLSATTPCWAYTHMRRHPESSSRIRRSL
jgi:nicotinate-nucleotide adenylyltransferase